MWSCGKATIRSRTLARSDAQIEIRAFNARERAQHRQGNLDGRGRRPLHGLETGGLPGMLRHGGDSFLVRYPLRITRRVKKPPLLHQKINRSWDNPDI